MTDIHVSPELNADRGLMQAVDMINVTGGAVSSGWWKGPRFGMEEGFVKIEVTCEDFNWQYIDFGEEVQYGVSNFLSN